MNNAALNICVQVFMGKYFSVIWGIYWGLELLAHRFTLCLTFWKTPDCFPKWLYHFTFPLATYGDSDFSTSLPALVFVYQFFIYFLTNCFLTPHSTQTCPLNIGTAESMFAWLIMCFSWTNFCFFETHLHTFSPRHKPGPASILGDGEGFVEEEEFNLEDSCNKERGFGSRINCLRL